MEKIIFIKLLNEGTKVYKPIPAEEIENNIYKVKGNDIYDIEDELWEFTPGTFVIVEQQTLDGKLVLVAVKEKNT